MPAISSPASARCSRRTRTRKTAINLNNLVNTVLALLRVDLQKDDVRVETRLDEQLPAVTGDAVQLQQVILNLIVNAADAMRSVEPRVLKIQTSRIVRQGARVDRGHGTGDQRAPIASASSIRCSRPRPAAWAWGFRSAARSSRTTAAASGSRPCKARARFFNSNCRLPKARARAGTWRRERGSNSGAGDRLALARIVRRIDVGDAPRAVAVELHDRLRVGPGVVVGARLHDPDRAGGQRMVFVLSNLSPVPMWNVPESTVTRSIAGCEWAGMT